MRMWIKAFWIILISVAIISSVYYAYENHSNLTNTSVAQKLLEENSKIPCQIDEDCTNLWISDCCNNICINKKIDASEFGYIYGGPDITKCASTDCIIFNCVCENNICTKKACFWKICWYKCCSSSNWHIPN